MRTLKYHSTNNGHCIVYYKDTDNLNKTLYGMQLETKSYTVPITHNQLKAIALAASTSHVRPHLNGIFFEIYSDDTIGMVATDGHRLHSLNLRRDESPKDSFIVAIGDIKKAITLANVEEKELGKLSGLQVSIRITKESIIIGIEELVKHQFTIEPLKGNYPDWRRVIPQTAQNDNLSLNLNALYLADFGKAMKLLTGQKIPHVKITSTGEKAPALITLSGCNEFLGVLMPMRNV